MKNAFELSNILRKNIKNLIPYSSARDEYKGSVGIFLDANENSFGSPLKVNYNRYPDPLQLKVKQQISSIKNIPIHQIFLGNGSDEAIDILFRAFCQPSIDNVIICPPTYGMYEVSANINDVAIQKVNLTSNFQLDTQSILSTINQFTKLIFICSPNNPTGNLIDKRDIEILLQNFKGLVVVDEAYIDFSTEESMIKKLADYPNLVVLQTFSKAWGLAGIRAGMAFASEEIIDIFNKVKPPYNVSKSTQQILLEALQNKSTINNWVKQTIEQKQVLVEGIQKLNFVEKVFPSDANFILVKMLNPKKVYDFLIENEIIVRDRSKVVLCDGCLRITIGTQNENQKLIENLQKYLD
jgi:histidinol-phosphate aminotransferase